MTCRERATVTENEATKAARLAEIKARLAAAEPEEWHVNDFTNEATAPTKAALRWLLHAPDDMKWLVTEIERLRRAVVVETEGGTDS